MTSTYYIKAYFTKPNQQQPEIRRFAIDISPENDVYRDLYTKIASFQAGNQSQEFTLQYTDEENERITFSSSDELRSAIALNREANTLKVFVTFNQAIPQQEQRQQQDDAGNKEVHPGVECDGCHGPVIGIRYKCFVCLNYDLCEKCSAAGIHSEHNMIKITKPGNYYYPNGPQFPHFQGRHHRHRRHQSPRTPPFTPSPDILAQIQAQIPQWLPNRANTEHIRTHIQQHLESLKTNTQTHVQNSRQYLESIGQYLQQALSPYGIDCDYRVDESTPTNNQQQQQQQQPPQNEEQASSEQQEEQISTTHTESSHEPDAVPKYPNVTVSHEETASSSAPVVEESTTIANPLEKALDDCMEKMKAMGFSDNGGLRELIRSKQGDINAVLDAINPRHYSS